jgi:competence protein ComEC
MDLFSAILGFQSDYFISQWLIELSLVSLDFLWQGLTWLSTLDYAVVSLSILQQKLLFGLALLYFIMIYITPYPRFNSSKLPKKLFLGVNYSLFMLSMVLFNGVFVLYSVMNLENKLVIKDEESDSNSDITTANSKSFVLSKLAGSSSADVDISVHSSDWQLILFDVGQGLSMLIQRNNHAILYDTGAAYPSGFNMSDAVILPYLKHAGIKVLDKVILSHSDNDHAGSIMQLFNGVTIKQLITNDTRVFKRLNSVDGSSCFQGERLAPPWCRGI